MPPDDPIIWPLDPHGKVKHLIFQRHLDAWLPIMTRSFVKLLYVDGFAGPGVYEGGEPGSPIIALRAAIFNRALKARPPDCELEFLFIEERSDRVVKLREEVKKLLALEPLPEWLKYQIAGGEFEAVMTGSFDRWSLHGRRPIFAFIDPFGYSGLPMSLIKRVASVPHSECLITFTYKSINRWAIHGDPHKEHHVDALYGTPTWRDCRGDEEAMVDLYRRQLAARGGFKYNCTFKMKDRVGATEYFLAFGTNDPKGLSVMKAATWKADPRMGRVFSDAEDPDQLFLDLPLDPLRNLLQGQFRGHGWITMDHVIDFVRPLRENLKHMLVSAPHHIEHFVNEADWNLFVEQIAHAIDENPAVLTPLKGQGQPLWVELDISKLSTSPTFCDALRIAKLAARRNLVAAGDRIPG